MDKHHQETCRLCNHNMTYFASTRKRDYYRCPSCDSIQLKASQILTNTDEKARYDTHINDVTNLGYQSFVSPITNFILNHHEKIQKGLDFGAGPGPVISTILKQKNYDITLYDPFYHNNQEALLKTYEYIFACEVIEHFNDPRKTFSTLYHLTRPKANWIFMTCIYDDSIDFSKWHYKNDETHIIFYTRKTLEYIKDIFRFQKLIIQDRLIVFIKKTA